VHELQLVELVGVGSDPDEGRGSRAPIPLSRAHRGAIVGAM